MNTTKLMAVAACAAACITTTAFADDDIVASASPAAKIADTVNPKPGMLFKGYNVNDFFDKKFPELPEVLQIDTMGRFPRRKGDRLHNCTIQPFAFSSIFWSPDRLNATMGRLNAL